MKPLRSVIIVLLFISANIVPSTCADWDARFDPNTTLIVIDEIEEAYLILSNLLDETSATINRNFVIKSENEKVAVIDNPDEIIFRDVAGQSGTWETHFRVRDVFLGTARFFVERKYDGIQPEQSNEVLEVIVSRPERLLDTLFAVTVVLLLTILFINFGAAIDLKTMKEIFRRPIGPAIGTKRAERALDNAVLKSDMGAEAVQIARDPDIANIKLAIMYATATAEWHTLNSKHTKLLQEVSTLKREIRENADKLNELHGIKRNYDRLKLFHKYFILPEREREMKMDMLLFNNNLQ